MGCSQCLGIEHEFDARTAQADLRRYRRRGPGGASLRLSQALIRNGVAGASLLDIGGGVGSLQHALLEAGVRRVRSVDASSAYLEAAADEARRRGWHDRIEATHGDFVAVADTIEAADIVTLDRVICCYHDMRALVRQSARRARRLYGVVYPREAAWLRPAFWLINLVLRLRRSPFRVFLHRRSEVEAVILDSGLRPDYHRHHGVWQVAVFARGTAVAA